MSEHPSTGDSDNVFITFSDAKSVIKYVTNIVQMEGVYMGFWQWSVIGRWGNLITQKYMSESPGVAGDSHWLGYYL